MCGICYLRRGISVHNHTFTFNFFEEYLSGDFISKEDKAKLINVSLSEHVINHKLLLPAIDIQSIKGAIQSRGPDTFYCVLSRPESMLHSSVEQVYIEKVEGIKDGECLMAQSILSLRGTLVEHPPLTNGTLLYNGEVYHTGELLGLGIHQSDTEWLYTELSKIASQKLSAQVISQLLGKIRGDYSLIYQRDNKVFLSKDYFGKKSLLIGFEENGLILSSVGIGEFESKREGLQEQKEEKEWLSKYKSEWNNSKYKHYFEVPRNVVISIEFLEKEAVWRRQYIHPNNLTLCFPKELSCSLEVVFEEIEGLLKQSVIELVSNIRQFQEYFNQKEYKLSKNQPGTTNAHIAVLFSGGLDSTLIARLLDLVLPQDAEIDLINIVFSPDAPDRKTSLKAYQELSLINKDRKYNLILRDQTLESIEEMEKSHIQLIYPKNTHMDFNISAVLSLASQLEGTLYGTQSQIRSGSKILLSGLGADELFSGYSRYRVAYLRAGIEEQEREMVFDLDRLWIRNLGRDDRAISNRGKEARYPFLYSPLVDYLKQKVPLHLMADYTRPKGEGDKIILREVAARLGLKETSKYKKTAIQFGTRLAKQSNIKAFGSNRKAKGTYHYEAKP